MGYLYHGTPGLPSASVDVIAAKRAELLAEDHLRELCRRHGFMTCHEKKRLKIPPSIQDKNHAGIATTTREVIEQMIGTELPMQEQAPSTSQTMDPRLEGLIPSVIKTEPGEDVKPTLRMDGPKIPFQ